MNKKTKRKNEGITLIALVISIIVLLILAGVSIVTLTGENGILTQAQNSKTATEKGDAEERINLVVNEWQIEKYRADAKDLETFLNSKVTSGEIDSVTKNANGTFTVEINKYNYTIIEDGTLPIKPGEKATKTVKNNYTDGTNTATIPAGFTVSSTDYTINTGLVVIGPDESEFVWVPVSDINDMAQCFTAGGSCNLVADANGHLSCQAHSNNTFIVGKLYATGIGESFSNTPNTKYNADSGLREPAIVKSHDNNTSYNNGLFKLNGLKSDYKLMAESVKKYGGFYVGRYEASLTSATASSAGTSGTMQSKQGVIPTAANNSYTYRWYGLYEKAKGYTVSEDSVQSSMIWGSQYDAMLNWVKSSGSSDASKIKTQGIGNTTSNVVSTTGNSNYSNDSINKIRDLGGNVAEWTLEARGTYDRVFRGGKYNYSDSPSLRYYAWPTDTYAYYGTRLTLYIK